MDITVQLLGCSTKEQIVEALTAHIKRYSGWEVSKIIFEKSEMSVYNYQLVDAYDGKRKTEQLLLVADLANCRESYGRLRHHDLGPVDLTIINNVVSQG